MSKKFEKSEYEGEENARRAQQKADSRPKRTQRIDAEDRPEGDQSIDRSQDAKEDALAKVDQGRPGPGRP